MTTSEVLLGQAIRSLLDGYPPNGTDPNECGAGGWVLRELLDAHETGGTPSVKAVWNTIARDTKNREIVRIESGCNGWPLEGAGAAITEILKTGCQGKPPALPAFEHAMTLDDLADFVNWLQSVPKVKSRDRARGAAYAVGKLLVAQRRLVFDTSGGGAPYIMGSDSDLWPLDADLLPVQALLGRAGLNPSEPAFKWLVADLKLATFDDAPRVELARWWTSTPAALYVSCGPSNVVKATPDGRLRLLPNGSDGIYFASDATLPKWDPAAEPVAPSEVGAFRPAIVTPADVGQYNPEIQRTLFDAWFVALVANVRPLPILAALGDKGGGKTHLIRAVALAVALDDPTTPSDDPRDLWTLATRRPVVALDNVDAKPALWLPDVLAAAVTGVTYERRKLYSDNAVVQSKATAAFAISSRTAAFARPDVAERTLPILTGGFDDADRASDAELIQDVKEARDGLLAWAATNAARLLARLPDAPTLPGRFVDFGRVAWAYNPEAAPAALRALQQAQALTVGDADPLVSAILEFSGVLMGEQGRWEGAASELVKALAAAGADLPYLGGGKAIGRMLREGKGTLALFGLELSIRRYGSNNLFALSESAN